MATKRPVLCEGCGAQIWKNGYCSSCGMHIDVTRKAHNTSNYYYNIGYDKAASRDLSGAIESLTMSLRYNKKNIMSRNLLGLIYYEMGEVVIALSHWVMSINYRPNDNLASRYLKELKQDPTRLDNVDQIAKKYNMALGYCETGDFDLAILQLKSVLSENTHFVKGYLLLTLIYLEEQNYEKAKVTIRRVLKIDKANPIALRYLNEIGISKHEIEIEIENNDEDFLTEEYMSEVSISLDGKTEGEKPAAKTKIFKEFVAKKKDETVKIGEFGDVTFARYSGIYVLVGLVIGILLLIFFIAPLQKKKLKEENEKLVVVYSEELASKNAAIAALKDEINRLDTELEEYKITKDGKGNPLPDYSDVKNGMSDEDIENMIKNE